jgi:hypothetical protein
VRRGREECGETPSPRKCFKQREEQVVDVLAKATNSMSEFYARLKKTSEFMPSEAHIFNVLMQFLGYDHPLLTQDNSLLKLPHLCTVELAEDGIHITLGEENKQGKKKYLGVRISSSSSGKLAYWTRASGDRRRIYL